MNNISKEAIQAYKILLKYSQLSLNHQINFRNVQLKNNLQIHQIYTLNTQRKYLPHLVLLHGFAGSAMSYIRTFHDLSKHFNVHALDHFGNGFSSRQAYDPNKSHKQTLNLYVNSIQKWRKQIGLQKFILAGHSFGGYIACQYMLQNMDVVDRLILLSPVGTSSQQEIRKEMQNMKEQSLKNKIGLSLIEKIYNMKFQPSKVFKLPLVGDLIVNQFLKSTIKLEKQQKEMWKKYIKYISIQESHIQKSFYRCFQWPFVSRFMSISQIIEKIVFNSQESLHERTPQITDQQNITNMNQPDHRQYQGQRLKQIQFYYGENDWTQRIAAKKLSAKYSNISFQIIQKATHNMIFDYPAQVVDRIINGPLKRRIQKQKRI